ncbi:MAG: DUF927 domain-containing protein [Candidatus Sedimenticola sp. (ex Thyasira tokunagai)]
MKWPTARGDLVRLTEALGTLMGGRREVAARHYDFEGEEGKRVKGWAPWKGRRVGKDYQAEGSELVLSFKNRKSGQLERRILKPLNVDNLLKHLRGKDRLGVYVLDKECKCSFLAADFDDHSGELDQAAVWDEVKKFWDACDTHDWQAHIERSKSGNGYHVWVFFDSPVSAAKARAIGRWLFEESQTLRDDDDFSTFDRFFPAQSALPPNGREFGNLIGLPLSGATDYEAGRCAWVSPESGKTICDPYEYTLAIVSRGRNPASQVDGFMEEWELKEEDDPAFQGEARDPGAALGTPEELEEVVSRCKFMQWSSDANNQADVQEPLWFSMISNGCRFDGADDWLHEASRHHAGYNVMETDTKILHARSSSGPHKCKTISKQLAFPLCPKGGCVLPNKEPTQSPAGLSVWFDAKHRKKKTADRSVQVAPPVAPREAPVFSEEIPIHEGTGQPWPDAPFGWAISNDGVMQVKQDGTPDLISLTPVWVDALTRNSIGMWGVSLKFFDLDWKLKGCAIPRDRLHEQGGVLGRELAALGLPILPGKEKWVSRFIVLQEAMTAKRIRAAGRLGWFDASDSPAVFVLPEYVIGKAPEDIVYQPDAATLTADTLHPAGSLAGWQEEIATAAKGNPILMFSVMLALAGPLLKPCQEQSGGFHLYGVTTGGKTTAVQVAASVWGCGADPQEGPDVTSIRKWYVTGNALESIAEVHNDTLLTLDEISEQDETQLGKIIYQLAGGISKGRATAAGGLRAMKTWRLLFFSTGEKSVRQMLSLAGQTVKGGQLVRLPDIPADDTDDGRRAIVTNSHGKDPKDFVQDLKAATARHYGQAGPVFVAYLVAAAEQSGMAALTGKLKDELRRMEGKLAEGIEDRLPPESRRVIKRFALVALAGWHAQQAGIIDWSFDEIFDATADVRDRWLSEIGQERSEVDRAISYLRDQLLANQGRFRDIESEARPGIETLGFKAPEHFLLTETSIRIVCGEHDAKTVLKQLKARGMLWHDKDRLTKKTPAIKGFSDRRINLYWISLDILGERDEFGAKNNDWGQRQAPLNLPDRPDPLGPGDDLPI